MLTPIVHCLQVLFLGDAQQQTGNALEHLGLGGDVLLEQQEVQQTRLFEVFLQEQEELLQNLRLGQTSVLQEDDGFVVMRV